ncbi:MAG: hypothetical protein KC456_08675 [Flavobacteriales bacterium]|nr:hypothetical protein [Flavobacteriales bacterium]
MSAIKAYSQYLLKRFQIVPLSILVLSDVLVISRIVEVDNQGWWTQAAVFFMVLAYLFNNRVGDDKRDFEFDAIHYPERAVQKGTIGIKQLETLGTITMALMALLSIVLGWTSVMLVLPVWFFGWWAKKDFSLPVTFKENYFFVYNFLNMLQMFVLQVFIYLSLLDSFEMRPIIWLHVAFVFGLSLQVEVTRKVKVAKTKAMDLYSDRMGMGGSIILWLVLGLVCNLIFGVLGVSMGVGPIIILSAMGCLFLIQVTGALLYFKSKKESYENLFWLAMISTYVGQNLVLAYG